MQYIESISQIFFQATSPYRKRAVHLKMLYLGRLIGIYEFIA